MGSPKTRPTVAARWPRGAEGQRRDIRAAADDAREILVEARAANEDRNPMLVAALLAMMEARVADIQRLAVEARIGPEPEGSES
jgi:hypothetical protein